MINISDFVAPNDCDQTAAIQAVIDAAPEGSTFDFGRGGYHCHASLNLTHREGDVIRGGSWQTPAIISHAAGRAAIDLVGSRYYRFEGFHLRGDDVDTPAAGFLAARTPSYEQVGECCYRDCVVSGAFTIAPWYLIDTEIVTLDHTRTIQIKAPYLYYCSSENDHGLESYLPISDKYDSCTQHYIHDCVFQTATGQDCTVIRLGKTCSGVRVRDSIWGPKGAGVGVEIAGNASDIVLDGVTQEAAAGSVFLKINDNVVVEMLSIRNCRFAEKIIQAGVGSRLYKAIVDNFQCQADGGIAGLELYDASRCTFNRWWSYNGAKITAHNLTDCEIELPKVDSLTVTGLNLYNRLVQCESGVRRFTVTDSMALWTGNGGLIVTGDNGKNYRLRVDAAGKLYAQTI